MATNLEITEVERSEKNVISVWVKICLRKSAPRTMKAKGKALESMGRRCECFTPVECRLRDSRTLTEMDSAS